MANAEEIKLWKLVDKAILKSLEKFGDVFSKDVTRELIDNDVVPVVRCKDCEWYENGKSYDAYCNHPTDGMNYTAEDDFCSYGERRNDV